jgi:ATP-dependent DNA helicase RecQ
LPRPKFAPEATSTRSKTVLLTAEKDRPRQADQSENGGPDQTPTFHRTHTATDPTADLTPDQQLLDAQLRAWRKAESERIGLPQFFVLGSSALRSIVLIRPKTIAQLQTIQGIGPDKAEKFGSSILNICSA